jgi:hypothetical protein
MLTFALAGATGAKATGPLMLTWGVQRTCLVCDGSGFIWSPGTGTDAAMVVVVANAIAPIAIIRLIATTGGRLMRPVILPALGICKLSQSTQQSRCAPSPHPPSYTLLTQFGSSDKATNGDCLHLARVAGPRWAVRHPRCLSQRQPDVRFLLTLVTAGDHSCPWVPVRHGPSTDRGSGPVWSRTPPAFRSSANRNRSAGRSRQGRSSLDPLHAIYGPSASSRPIWLLSCDSDCPLVTVVDRE